MTRETSLLRVYAALVALTTGIVAAERVSQTLALGVGGCALVASGWRRRPVVSLIGLMVATAGCGVLVNAPRVGPSALAVIAEGVVRCELTGRVLEHAGGLGTLLAADRIECEGVAPVDRAGVVVVEPARVDAGAVVHSTGWLVGLRGDDTFDEARRRLGAQAAFHMEDIETRATPPGLHRLASSVRAGLERATSKMDRNRAGLLAGLTTGETSSMDPTAEEQLRRAGLSHLVAVSGSNVAMVVGATALVVSGMALWARVVASGLALGLFVLVVGPEPSVLRAAVMGAIALLALTAGRRAEPLHALGLALIVLLALRPGLVYSVGLQLSVAATGGIVLFSGPLRRLLDGALPGFVSLALAVTLAAQFAVAPVLVGTFGELSLVAPLANVLAVPAVPPATVLGLMAAVTGAVAPPLGWMCTLLAEPCVAWVLAVGQTTGSWSWASVEVPSAWAWPLGALVASAAAVALASPGGRSRPGRGDGAGRSRPK